MGSVEANGGTNPEPALAIAARLNPDVIYLLSDGEFQPLNTRTLKLLTHQKITVHTIAFESPEGERTLRQISNATGGTHRFEPVNDTADASYLELVAGLADEMVEQRIRPVNYRPYGGGRRILQRPGRGGVQPRGRLLLLLAAPLAAGHAALCGLGRLGAAELHHVLGV